jgi:hypothetical protein
MRICSIVPGLFVGGTPPFDDYSWMVATMIFCCEEPPDHYKYPNVEVLHCRLLGGDLSVEERGLAMAAAADAATRIVHHKAVLVVGGAGLSRAPLVAALTLRALSDMDPTEAVELVQRNIPGALKAEGYEQLVGVGRLSQPPAAHTD